MSVGLAQNLFQLDKNEVQDWRGTFGQVILFALKVQAI